MDRDGFRDRNDRYRYLVARENAHRIAQDPAVMEQGRRHLERFSGPDPYQRDGVALWLGIFKNGPDEVIRRLLERTPRGDYARETAPSFGTLPAQTRARLAREAASPLPDVEQAR